MIKRICFKEMLIRSFHLFNFVFIFLFFDLFVTPAETWSCDYSFLAIPMKESWFVKFSTRNLKPIY